MPFWIFDLDGTLIDTLEDLAAALNRALQEVGAPVLPTGKVRDLVGGGVRHLIGQALPPAMQDSADQTLSAFLEHYARGKTDRSRLYPGVRETLEALQPAPMAVATNKPEGLTRDLLAWFELAAFFPVVVGGDSLPVRKPDPGFLGEVMQRLGVGGRDGRMVGDSGTDIVAGKQAGLRTVAVTYGFRDREELLRWEPDHVIARFEDLLDLHEN